MKLDVPTWQKPVSRSFDALSDCGLYAEVIQVASKQSFISAAKLISPDQGLRQRMRRLHLVQFPTKTNINALVHALLAFGWLVEDPSQRAKYVLSEEGRKLAEKSESSPRDFRRALASKLHERYIIPGWFVARLHALNPVGQGEIVLPAPPKSLRTERRPWNRTDWPTDFDELVAASASRANLIFPGSFPIQEEIWLQEVQHSWIKLGAGNPPTSHQSHGKEKQQAEITFGTRERLVHAMREAAVHLLFGVVPPGAHTPDFISQKHPIPPRSFQVWCPRLDELEFLFYTDYHPLVPGRLLVPCGAFRYAAPTPPFEVLDQIKDPSGRSLWLHQPPATNFQETFMHALEQTYKGFAKQVGAMYVSLLNVRDEVCRQLRLSSNTFDILLEFAYRNTLRSDTKPRKQISISLESDITQDQKGAVGLNRRPVYIGNIPHSLIAIAAAR